MLPATQRRHFANADRRQENGSEHRDQRNEAEHDGNGKNQRCALPRGRVHKEWYQRLARPENEDNEHRPGRYGLAGLLMHVRVLAVMVVFVVVNEAFMRVNV